MRNYLQFVVKERRLLSFGFTFTFFSNFGQTFLISLFVPFFLETFSLSNGSFGFLFSGATLVSALSLPFLGKRIDYLPLKRFSLMVAAGLMLAAFTLSISWHVSVLFTGILMLRLSAQGLSAHTAQTAMTKFFDFQRGKALSIADLGYPLGETLITLTLTAMLPLISWRTAWAVISLGTGVLLIPFICRILSGETEEKIRPQSADNRKANQTRIYKTIMRDPRFFLHLPAVVLLPFWLTSLFLYQFSIGQQLGWSSALIASAFLALAASRITSSLSIGPLVDRLGATTLFPYHLIPVSAGLLIACLNPGTWAVFAYMFLLGITLGVAGNITSSLWVDMYGKESIGSVKSLFSSLMIVSSSLSPFVIGHLIDSAIPISQVLLGAAISLSAATVLAFLAFRKESLPEAEDVKPDISSSNLYPAIPRQHFMLPSPDHPGVPILCCRDDSDLNKILHTVKAQYSDNRYRFHQMA